MATVPSGSTPRIVLQVGGFLVDQGGACADARGFAGGVAVGRVVAGRGAGVAGGPGPAGRAAARPGAAVADRAPLAAGGGGGGPLGDGSWAAVDSDGDLCAVDGGQAAHGLGLRDAGAGGVGLAAPAALLPDPAGARGCRTSRRCAS